MMAWRSALLLAALVGAAPAWAQQSDEGALRLADDAPDTKATSTDWRAFLEGGVTDARLRDGASQLGERLSLDMHDDSVLAPGWRFILADRLDLEHVDNPDSNDNFNTLKEAYLSWQVEPNFIVDAGRVNLRYGVATGYNPTDFFRTDAIRSIVSLDPSSLRENRQGSVVVEGQYLSDSGSLSALVSPKLADQANSATFSPDFGATNNTDRWLVAGSQKITDGIAPQLLLYGGTHTPTQAGFNFSMLANQATTAYLEWSAGRGSTLLDDALGLTRNDSYQRRYATGLTTTTDFNLSLTLEYEGNSAGLNQGGLEDIGRAPPYVLLRYLGSIEERQDLPTRHGWFASGTLTDAGLQHLDLTSFVRYDPVSHSRLQWGEGRYHFEHADIALQLEYYSGSPRSIYGAVPTQRVVEVLLRYFL